MVTVYLEFIWQGFEAKFGVTGSSGQSPGESDEPKDQCDLDLHLSGL
jgi:hypothetical protein